MVSSTQDANSKPTNSTEPMNIKGDIGIDTKNILPIIKKWLYSENEIFVRELISNAFDAINKRHRIATVEDDIELPEAKEISIKINKTANTITFSDNGLGLDADECQKYINTIAFSGATDFIEKYQGKDDAQQVIGHFGL